MRVPDPLPGRNATACLAFTLLLFAPSPTLAQPTPWGPEIRVNTYTSGAQHDPSVAAYQSNFVIVWESDGQDGDQSGLFAQRYEGIGGAFPLGTEFRVNSYTTGPQHAASAAAKWGGSFVIAWQSDGQDGDAGGIIARRWSGSGAPLGGEFQANTYTTGGQVTPAAAMDASGDFVVVWASLGQDGSGYGIFGQRYASSGAPLGGEFQVNAYTTGFQGHPRVGMTPEGYFVVAWEGEWAGEDGFGVFARRYFNDGTPLGGEFRVNTFTTDNQRYPSVAADSDRFVVTWQSEGQDGSGYGIYARRFNFGDGSPIGAAFQVNDSTNGSQVHPSVSTNLWLNCGITWTDEVQDPRGGIFAIAPYGCVGGVNAHVNTTTAGAQTGPVIAAGGFDYLFAVWTSEQDPDGSVGVYAQLLNPGWLPVELQNFTVE